MNVWHGVFSVWLKRIGRRWKKGKIGVDGTDWKECLEALVEDCFLANEQKLLRRRVFSPHHHHHQKHTILDLGMLEKVLP